MSQEEVSVSIDEEDFMNELVGTLSSQEEKERHPSGIEVEENHIYFYADVGEKEALELVRILRRLDVEMGYLAERISLDSRPPIHLHIHSPGGDIFSCFNICDAIDNCKSAVHTYVEGSAASAATVIFSRGKKRFITKRSFMLIHQPQVSFYGKRDDFVDETENQKNFFNTVVEMYLERSNMSREEIESLLSHELWLPANRCLELGLVDKII